MLPDGALYCRRPILLLYNFCIFILVFSIQRGGKNTPDAAAVNPTVIFFLSWFAYGYGITFYPFLANTFFGAYSQKQGVSSKFRIYFSFILFF